MCAGGRLEPRRDDIRRRRLSKVQGFHQWRAATHRSGPCFPPSPLFHRNVLFLCSFDSYNYRWRKPHLTHACLALGSCRHQNSAEQRSQRAGPELQQVWLGGRSVGWMGWLVDCLLACMLVASWLYAASYTFVCFVPSGSVGLRLSCLSVCLPVCYGRRIVATIQLSYVHPRAHARSHTRSHTHAHTTLFPPCRAGLTPLLCTRPHSPTKSFWSTTTWAPLTTSTGRRDPPRSRRRPPHPHPRLPSKFGWRK